MDYAFSAIAVLVVTAIVLFYNRIDTRKHALVRVYANLDALIAAQTVLVRPLALAACASAGTLGQIACRMEAIRTLGIDGVDQRIESYLAIQGLVENICALTTQWDELRRAFEEKNIQVETARQDYNRAALVYNDCQRNALQDWFARMLGHTMAPPC